ncbi:hypothetical protein [Sphingomonas sp. UYAg733]
MPKSLSFSESVIATARQKRDAAASRALPNAEREKPRDVILAAVAQIAAQLQEDGFAFYKSGPGLKRVGGDLSYEIIFQSDRNNIAGQRAAVWIHGAVSSRKLADWRRRHDHPWLRREGPQAGVISGGQIGNLGPVPSWMEWDFADPVTRPAEIDDAVTAIRRIMLPFFDLFDDPAAAVDVLVHHPVCPQKPLLEYAISILGKQAAEAALLSLLMAQPALRARFDAARAKFACAGLPQFSGDTASELAELWLAAGFGSGLTAEANNQ